MTILAQANRLIKIAAPKVTREEDKRPEFRPATPRDAWAYFGMRPAPHQLENVERKTRFSVDVWHRRAGKSVSQIMKLLDRAANCPFPNGRYAYLGPTYSQVEDIAWAELRERALQIPGATIKDSRLAVYIPTVRGSVSRIRLYGVDSPKQRLRGGYLDGVVVDEWQHIPEHVWTQQVRPMLSDKSRQGFDHRGYPNQWATFIGTPLGRNHLYRMYDRAARWQAGEAVTWRRHDGSVVTNTSDNWSASLYTVHQTGMVTPEEIANLQADLSPTEFAQEYECDFEAGVEGAIYRLELEELRASGRITDVRYNPNLQVNTCWDLGWNDMTVVWFFQRVAGTPIFIGYLQFIGAAIPTIVQRVREYAVTDGQVWRLGVNYMPHDVAQHELGSGKSRISQFSEAGLIGTPVRKAPKIEQITATRRLLKHAVFSRACMDGLDLLATYRRERDEKTGVLKEEPVHDMASHVADALATGAIGMPKWSFGSRYNSQTTAET